jgi:hypothetical protein
VAQVEEMTGLNDDAARQLLRARSADRSKLVPIALFATFIGVLLAAASVAWGHSRTANVLATAAGLAVGIPIAVLIVDVMLRGDRRVRYAELVWIATQTALQITEELGQTIAWSASLVGGAATSVQLYFRAAAGPNRADDEEADYWSSRTSAEARWHSQRMAELRDVCVRFANDGTPLSDVAASSLGLAASRLARLEDLGPRLVPAAADDNDIQGLVRLLWRAGDRRYAVVQALGQRQETGDDAQVWECLGQLLAILKPLYDAALDVASVSRGPADRAEPVRGLIDGPWEIRWRRRAP